MYITYPTHIHTDEPCKHDLRLCTHCGDVYCAKCNKEWRKPLEYSLTYTSGAAVWVDGNAVSHTHS
jgi:hypothetical protein